MAFVDEAAIAELNDRYREADGSTDVLSFDYSPDEAGPAEAGQRRGDRRDRGLSRRW